MILKFNKDSLFSFENILLMIYLCTRLNPDLQNSDSVLYISIPVLLSLVILLKLFIKKELSLKKIFCCNYVRWIVVFTCFSLFSFIWSISPATSNINFFIINLITMIPFSLYISNNIRIENVMKIFIAATIVTTVYMLIFTDVSMVMIEGARRLGSEDEGWNSNAIALMCSISTLFCLYFLHKRNEIKFIYLLLFATFILIIILTGSRSGLFRILISYLLYLVFSKERNKLLYGIISIVLLIFVLYLVMNIPFLYNTIGVRIESLTNLISTTGYADSSSITRLMMMKNAFEWFSENPLLGYGIDNFRYLWFQVAGYETYAHSNYLDLLVGIGIIGTGIYYWFYGKQILILYKRLNYNRKLCAVYLAILCTLLILDLITVTYNSRISQIVLCLTYCAGVVANINPQDKEHKIK
jgi:O-antigen ligase